MAESWGRLETLFACAWVGLAGPALAQEQPPAPDAASPGNASNITSYKPDFFAEFRPNTALDMVGRIPGFSFDGGSNARGFSGTAGNVLIDGERPPSRSDSLSSIVARIPASGVERIDVIRGGAEGIDMQGKPIIANVIRKKEAGVTGVMSAGISVNDAGKVSPNAQLQLRRQADGQLLEGSLGVSRSEGLNENMFTRRNPLSAVLRQGNTKTESTFQRVEGTGAWETIWLGGKLRLNGLLRATSVDYGSRRTLAVPGGAQVSDGSDEDLGAEAGIRFTRNLDGGYALELVGFQSMATSDNSGASTSSGIAGQADYTSGNGSDDKSGESIARATLQAPAMGDWSFEGGGEAVFNYSERDGSFTFNGAPVNLGGNRNRVEELRADGFLTGTWAPSVNLNIEMGARYEWSQITAESNAGDSEKALTYLKPRVNVSWTPEKGHQWGARIEQIVDQLDFGGFASSAQFEEQIFGIGNPEIEPEKRWETELRYERQFGGQTSVVVKYTHTDVEDVLGRAVVTVPGTPPAQDQQFEITRNTGDAALDVLNASGSFQLDSWGMPGGILTMGGTLIETRLTDPVTGVERENDYTSPWSWNVSLQQTLGNGDFRWAVFLEDDADEKSWSPHEFNRFHGGMFLGANVTWKPWAGWTFGAGVNNIIAEDATAEFDFFDAVRTVGATPTYTTFDTNSQYRNFFANVRVNF